MDRAKGVILDQCADTAYINTHKSEFGGKTVALATLTKNGFPVPPFVALNAGTVNAIAGETIGGDNLRKLMADAHLQLAASRYAVRSSAFAEDGNQESHAGEFTSHVNVSPEGLCDAVNEVVADTKMKGYATGDRPFSVIIQKFIEAERGGVIFTRDPFGGREAVIEWHEGRVDAVVGGAPVLRAYVNDDRYHAAHPRFPHMRELFVTARRIEELFGRAQDIEWVINGNVVYILQSRPVTTISAPACETLRKIDEEFRDKDIYFLSHNEVGESFSSVTPLGLDILKVLYEKNGPIARVYHAQGIRTYTDNAFAIVRGTLYVDKIHELHQFFPAYDYVPSKGGMVPRIARFRSLLTSIKNGRRLAGLVVPRSAELGEKIAVHTRHALAMNGDNAKTILSDFMAAYEDIFTINLFSEQVFRDARRSLRETSFPLATLLSLPLAEMPTESRVRIPKERAAQLVGNSVNIADLSPFLAREDAPTPSADLLAWWRSLAVKEKARLTPIILRLQEFQSLREDGRALTVLFVNMLREALSSVWDGEPVLMYEASLDELVRRKFNTKDIQIRAIERRQTCDGYMPDFIATVPPALAPSSLGVSCGVASGIVCARHAPNMTGTILFVERLTPDLAQYLHDIKGIIATEGGILSHMAIVAREAGIPVVIEPQFMKKFHIGDFVTIDGGLGTIVSHPQ